MYQAANLELVVKNMKILTLDPHAFPYLTYKKDEIVSYTANRSIHSTGVKKMGEGHGHEEPFYLHAKHMYNLDRMKNQKLKVSLGVFTAFSIGVIVPIYAVVFQQRKTASA